VLKVFLIGWLGLLVFVFRWANFEGFFDETQHKKVSKGIKAHHSKLGG